jgi:hypothetical protein
MKEPKRVQVKPSKKADKPGKSPIGGPARPQPHDDIDSADVPISDEEARDGFQRLPSK